MTERILGSATSAETLIGHLLNRAGLLIERQPGILSFAHLTFQEYLTAQAIRDENAQGVTIQTLSENHFHARWREVILLFCRLAPPALVRQLLAEIQTAQLRYIDDEAPHFSVLLEAIAACPVAIREDPPFRREVLVHLLSVRFVETTAAFPKAPPVRIDQSVFPRDEIAATIRSGAGLGLAYGAEPLGPTWGNAWLLDNPDEWQAEIDHRTLDAWRDQPAETLSQAIWRYYCFSPLEELAARGIRPELWRAPLFKSQNKYVGLQARSALVGLTWRVVRWARRSELVPHSHPTSPILSTMNAPEELLVELLECSLESTWTNFELLIFMDFFIEYRLAPATPILKNRFFEVFRQFADMPSEMVKDALQHMVGTLGAPPSCQSSPD